MDTPPHIVFGLRVTHKLHVSVFICGGRSTLLQQKMLSTACWACWGTLLLIDCFSVCLCYPTGAPEEACGELLPGHTPNVPQISAGPFTLNLAALRASSSLVYSPEQEYEGKLIRNVYITSEPIKGYKS